MQAQKYRTSATHIKKHKWKSPQQLSSKSRPTQIGSDSPRYGRQYMPTILVIDDAAPIRLLLSTALQSAGYNVVEAPSGREGLALYRQHPSDVVIVDMLMPELNGLDTIMEFTREFLNVKVIAVSGMDSDQTMLQTAKLLGARQTLVKPFDFPTLLHAVQYELQH